MDLTLIVIVAFFALLAVVVLARTSLGAGYEVKNSDILVVLIPIAIWLTLSGHIQEIAFGDFKITAAIKEATAAPVENTVMSLRELPVERVQSGAKGGTNEIPRIVNNRSEALTFQLGHGGYWGPAIEEYLQKLTPYAFFKWVIINDERGQFFAMADAQQIGARIDLPDGKAYAKNLAGWLNRAERDRLKQLPGFISVDFAVTPKTDRRLALTRMNELDAEVLPVIDARGQLAGMVERSKLSAEILIDVSNKLGAL